MEFAGYIARRYLRSRRHSRFLSRGGVTAVVGMTIGVAVLNVTLAIMNGFHAEMRRTFVENMPMISIITSAPEGFTALGKVMDEVGADVAKFIFLTRRPNSHLDFDLDLAKSRSNENPVYYIQYAHARICSVFRNLEQTDTRHNQAIGEAALDLLGLDRRLDLDLREEVDHVLGAAVEFGVPVLAPEALDLGRSHAGNADRRERFAHIVQFEWFDYRIDFFHLVLVLF